MCQQKSGPAGNLPNPEIKALAGHGKEDCEATPAFNASLCERHQVAPLEFDGRSNAVFQPFNLEQRRFMEYMADHGAHADVPVATIVAAWKEAYGEARVLGWIAQLEGLNGQSHSDFACEQVWKGD